MCGATRMSYASGGVDGDTQCEHTSSTVGCAYGQREETWSGVRAAKRTSTGAERNLVPNPDHPQVLLVAELD